MGIYISFLQLDRTTLTQLFGAPFVKLQNFIGIFDNGLEYGELFLYSLKNIAIFGLLSIPITFIIAMLIALLLNNKFKGRTIVRGLILLPYITPDAVMYNVWRFIYYNKLGILNLYLMKLGITDEPIIWLVGSNALYAVIIANIWKGWPYLCLILLAGLQTIPSELYEAARIDGANWRQRFGRITMPMLGPIIKTIMVLSFIWTFHAFSQFYILFGGNTTVTNGAVPSIVILRAMQTSLDFGLGAAMSVILLLITFVFTLIFISFGRNKEENI